MRAALTLVAACALAACASGKTTGQEDGGGGDLSVSDDFSVAYDFAVPRDLAMSDLIPLCDVDANFRLCSGKCVGPTGCCDVADCATPANGTAVCTSNVCGFSCKPGFRPCGSECIPDAGCCDKSECTSPTDPCSVVAGASCVAHVCTYQPVICPLVGQTCAGGVCNCAAGQQPCQTAGKCIPNGTCCTSADCSAIVGQVCPAAGGVCSCLMGNKPCAASSSCIAAGSCCDSTQCAFSGQICSGPGGSCSCMPGQKPCAANGACIANANCCTSADCLPQQTCSGAGGSCNCPANTFLCPLTNTCIPTSTCCDSSNCTMSGAVCSGVGGSCGCTAGTHACSATNSCISNSNCCTSAECTAITGQVCSASGGTCQCPAGQKVCGSTCIPNGNCCTAGDCPATFQVASTKCTGGVCGVNTCNGGFVNVNGAYSDGCECGDDGYGKGCGSATPLGTIALTGSTSRTGVLPLIGEENWFVVTFGGTGDVNYHPRAFVTGAGIVLDVYSNCSFGIVGCGTEGGQAIGRTDWDVLNNNGQPWGFTWAPTPAVGTGGTVVIRVRRASGAVSCSSYTLTVTN